MSRVLLLHASVGTGHRRAAEALQAAFERLQPDAVRVEDVLDYTPRLFRLAYERSYLELTNYAPRLWGMFYAQTDASPDLAEISNNFRKLVESIGTNGLKEVLRSFRPDAIICTHFLPMELLVRLKRTARFTAPIYCTVTDYAAHTFWIYDTIDGYFVGSEQVREQLCARGVLRRRICVSGIPIDLRAAEPGDRTRIRRQLGFAPDAVVITLFGGGVSSERVRLIADGLLRSGIDGQLEIVAGRNPTLHEALADLRSNAAMQLQVHGYIDYVDDLLVASDLVITKAGGLIISEVLARQVPLLVIDPIPGQEEWNADFVVSSAAGMQLRMVEAVPWATRSLLAQPKLRDVMRWNAARVARPRAALDIASRVLSELKERNHG
jgi:processive 1,2-diacylglycerol beta-glucosyltransferase